MDNSVPENALQRKTATFTLAGKAYTFKEPGKCRGFELYSAALKMITGRHEALLCLGAMVEQEEANKEKDAGEREPVDVGAMMAGSATGMDFLVDAYGFVCDALDLQGDTRTRVKDCAEADEVGGAFMAIFEILRAPLAGGSPSTAQEIPTPDPTPSKSSELTTP